MCHFSPKVASSFQLVFQGEKKRHPPPPRWRDPAHGICPPTARSTRAVVGAPPPTSIEGIAQWRGEEVTVVQRDNRLLVQDI